MFQQLIESAKEAKSKLKIKVGRVLEVGSYNVNGTIRDVFQGDSEEYIGVDASAGPGVDIQLNGEDLLEKFAYESFDTVLCFEALEHTARPWLVVDQMKSVLKKGGHLWVSTPTFGFAIHRYPIDCYRFGEDAYRYWMFADMNLLSLDFVYACPMSPVILAIGQKQ